MDFKEFKEEILKQAGVNNIVIDEEAIEKLYNFMNLILEWNRKINLTTIVEPRDIITKHFIDSLTISKDIIKNSSVIDVGTGGGFPGIPLKILRKDIKLTLLDSQNKRVKFLNDVIEKLSLDNIIALHGRAEDVGKDKDYRERYDYACSRAVANLRVLSEYMLPFVRVGGKCICMKGPNVNNEIKESKKAIDILGGKIEKIELFRLYGLEAERSIVKIDKKFKTPEKYPRKAGDPVKKPL